MQRATKYIQISAVPFSCGFMWSYVMLETQYVRLTKRNGTLTKWNFCHGVLYFFVPSKMEFYCTSDRSAVNVSSPKTTLSDTWDRRGQWRHHFFWHTLVLCHFKPIWCIFIFESEMTLYSIIDQLIFSLSQDVALYWLCSSGFALGQNLLMLSPTFRRACWIPRVEDESLTPYRDLCNKFKKYFEFGKLGSWSKRWAEGCEKCLLKNMFE